jgi:DNA transformation protein and related proteins
MPAKPRERPGDEFAAYVAEMLAPLGAVQSARLFSGHGFKLGGVQFAMIIRGALYLRADAALAEELAALGAKPFAYTTKLRTVTVASYYAVPEDRLDDSETLLAWARRAVAAARAKSSRRRKS